MRSWIGSIGGQFLSKAHPDESVGNAWAGNSRHTEPPQSSQQNTKVIFLTSSPPIGGIVARCRIGFSHRMQRGISIGGLPAVAEQECNTPTGRLQAPSIQTIGPA